ncbi:MULTISPECIES: DUF423 domain-containing protein [unclassified Neptuniibacter]|jgi:uncharacterized membrane protein YgdD (TMEM256/DUF423 family)|uniref:DUF423 domain-containing protein n=1 Tax=unclassified Neptuniibacter TaxID=2630693 RepID=UPI0026E2ECA9|nr:MULTISPECIES: DUF423 domain-containing protein [unclassified Neptuniibacter]MDO6515280.1 DUF423 domain-containing protein [Neptuniibacter sp. 2_MG-2023]MDO6594319.1 DUF423 domain-containing protein [Neptuniibacter sp. 1_MG-2023]
MSKKLILMISAMSGFFAVACGAFGAHGLKDLLEPNLYAVYQTGVEYQFYHTFALLFIAVAPANLSSKHLGWAGIAFTLGILLFSGSLYLLALTGIKVLGAITPLGGVAFLCGWALVGYTAIISNRR